MSTPRFFLLLYFTPRLVHFNGQDHARPNMNESWQEKDGHKANGLMNVFFFASIRHALQQFTLKDTTPLSRHIYFLKHSNI